MRECPVRSRYFDGRCCFLQTGYDYAKDGRGKKIEQGQLILYNDAEDDTEAEEAVLVVCRVVGGKPMADEETPLVKAAKGQTDIRFNASGARPQFIWVWDYVELQDESTGKGRNLYVINPDQILRHREGHCVCDAEGG